MVGSINMYVNVSIWWSIANYLQYPTVIKLHTIVPYFNDQFWKQYTRLHFPLSQLVENGILSPREAVRLHYRVKNAREELEYCITEVIERRSDFASHPNAYRMLLALLEENRHRLRLHEHVLFQYKPEQWQIASVQFDLEKRWCSWPHVTNDPIVPSSPPPMHFRKLIRIARRIVNSDNVRRYFPLWLRRHDQ